MPNISGIQKIACKMRQHVESAVILLQYKCGWFFCPPTLPSSVYYSVYIYHPPGICGRGKNTSISGGSVCLILVLYVLYIPMFHLRDSGVKFSLWHQILEHMNHRRQCDMSSKKIYLKWEVFICLMGREGELDQREG
jgi:hypothetical protein